MISREEREGVEGIGLDNCLPQTQPQTRETGWGGKIQAAFANMKPSEIITILILFLGIPVGIMILRDVLRRFKIRNPLFWGLAPILLIFGVLMPLCIEWTLGRAILIVGMELGIAFALLGLFNAQRFFWAFRALALMIFLAYGSYLIHEFVFTDKPLTVEGRRSDASPRNSLLGFIIIGLPCLWFVIRGGFTLKEEESKDETLDDDDRAA